MSVKTSVKCVRPRVAACPQISGVPIFLKKRRRLGAAAAVRVWLMSRLKSCKCNLIKNVNCCLAI